jgi:DNA-binding MarR family transcriptional regulator
MESQSAEELYGEEASTNLKLIVTLTKCVQSIYRKEDELIHQRGLTRGQFGVLELLYHKGPMRIMEIIEKKLTTGGNMTVIIDNLVKQSLVARKINPRDRRGNIIELTKTGEKAVKEFFPAHLGNLKDIFHVLNNKEKLTFINLCKKLGKSIHLK